MTVNITLPEFSLVVLIGVSGSGKSTFARTHFLSTEIISSDFCRGLVSDDENSQDATKDAFEVVHFIAGIRLANMKLTVIDATSVQPDARKPLIKLAREHHALLVAIVLDVPERICMERNQKRPDRNFGPQVIKRQRQELKRSLRLLEKEGFRQVYVLKSEEEIADVQITRQPLHNNLKHEHGPFDIIGDVHGCFDELVMLLENMGYACNGTQVTPPDGRKVIFLGDLVDRGPKIPDVLRLVMGMVEAGTAICIPGNHDIKLMRKLRGRDVQIKHGLAESLAQLENETAEFKKQVADFIEGLVSHYVLDGGRLVVAHAGMKENYAGRASGTVREFALYGETTGETDEFGLPVRHNWAAEYRGNSTVVYGHTPVPQAEWLNRTINIDTGCVFGGALTALRYPEKEVVSVPARHTYSEPVRPFLAESAPVLTSQQQYDDVLDIEDVIGKRLINTRLMKHITIREENAIAALEVMSRFAVNPKWLIYLPPTMSPTETTQLPDLLEHPLEAFAYYRDNGVPQVICEEKHMGSRAVVIVCRDEDAARRRFGVIGEGFGVCYTRTGRRFFDDRLLETEFLSRVRNAIGEAGWWDELNTDWVALDCELMPWSAKAQELLQRQYAAVGSAAGNAMHETIAALEMTSARLPDAAQLLGHFQPRAAMVNHYIEAYRRYCWEVTSIDDLRLAPFHLLASERATHADKSHVWHMEMIGKLHQVGETVLYPTAYKIVDVTNPDSQAEGVRWWEEMTGQGGEGMVVKPLDFIVKGRYGILQPAMKVRGREYLRIIYGPEYTAPEQIVRLRSRGLKGKRSLAAREFALSIESLERFVQKEPLRRVHECVFGVLALESEPVDPRL
ncbi:MAG: polynucleotide kinase-phosphatase [Anaerolineae bacterium]|nr:polynucleotide kinase-phosphatase [Anaerolineae bacterium]